MGERKLMVVDWSTCTVCGGNGWYDGDPKSEEMCETCCGLGAVHTPLRPEAVATSDDIAALVAARPHDEAVALLRALLRARPEAAVEAVDWCRVAREWDGPCRESLGGNRRLYSNGEDRGTADARFLANGWVLVGGAR